MLRKVMLRNHAGKTLGILAVDENDLIVNYGGGYFAKQCEGTMFQGELMPIFQQPNTIYCTNKLDIEFPARKPGE